MFKQLKEDIQAVFARDPAARQRSQHEQHDDRHACGNEQ